MNLPIQPPFPPMEARRVDKIPTGDVWQFEPKWDGFRAIAFRDGDEIALQSKAGQPLARYFPEVVEALRGLEARQFVLDGEIVVPVGGRLSFDDLLQRIHPAASRVKKLSEATPAHYFVFDLLYAKGTLLTDQPIEARRARLEELFASVDHELLQLSPATTDRKLAGEWFDKFSAAGLDGVMAKRLGEPYHSGDREGMVKVKHLKTADCVVGGFRYGNSKKCAARTRSRCASPAARAAGPRSAPASGCRSARSWCARWSTTTSRKGGFGTGRSSCAGGRTRRRSSARWTKRGRVKHRAAVCR
jgi:ATP-dependent DNA ligase